MNQIAFHEFEMMRHFEAGRIAAARWHCRIWTRLVAGKINDGTEASGPAAPQPAATPSPYSVGEGAGRGAIEETQ